MTTTPNTIDGLDAIGQELREAVEEANKAREARQKEMSAKKAPMPTIQQEPEEPAGRPVSLETLTMLQRFEAIDEKARMLPVGHPSRRKAEKEIASVLRGYPEVAREYYLQKVEAALEKFEGRQIPNHIVGWIMSTNLVDMRTWDEFSTHMDAVKVCREHQKEVENDPNHNRKECTGCDWPKPKIYWMKGPDPAGDENVQVDVHFSILQEKEDKELRRYTHDLYELIHGWEMRSREKRNTLAAVCSDAGVDQNYTLLDIIRGAIPGKTVLVAVPRHDPFVSRDNRNGNDHRNSGFFFVHQLSEEEAKERGVTIPKGCAAITVSAPDKDEGLGMMCFLLNRRFSGVYVYSTVDPERQPFFGIRDGKGNPASSYGLKLESILSHARQHVRPKVARKEGAESGAGADEKKAEKTTPAPATATETAGVAGMAETDGDESKKSRRGDAGRGFRKAEGGGRPKEAKGRGGAKNWKHGL